MPLDVAFLFAGVPLVIAALASRPRFWELVALTGLAAMTIQAGRNAVWLVLFAATPAAAWLTGSREWRLHPPRFLTAVLAACLAGVLAIGLGRAPAPPGAGEELRARAALEVGQRADPRRRHQRRGTRTRRANGVDRQPARCLRSRRPAPLSRLDRGPHFGGRAAQVLPGGPGHGRQPAGCSPGRGDDGWRVAARDERAVLFVRARR